MKLEIVDQDGTSLVKRDNQQYLPSVGEEIKTEQGWYKVVERTFYYREVTSVLIWVEEIMGAK